MTLARCPLHWAHDLTDAELAKGLAAAGLGPATVAGLVADRHTNGAEQRIEATMGPLPEHVGLVSLRCLCGTEAEGADPELEPPDPPYEPEVPLPDPPERVLPNHVLADRLPYDEVAWAEEYAAAAESQAAADAAELGW